MLVLPTNQLDQTTDNDLLWRYGVNGDRAALEELVRRFANMVYAAACRQVRDQSMAEDVVQTVFITFARRARDIRSSAALATWLLRTTHYTAANMIKGETRRLIHEQAACRERSEVLQNDPADADEQWKALSPLIDRAIARLGAKDQTAVVLRFFRGLSLRDLGQAIGTSEEAARKRVSRALEKLRNLLIQSGAPDDTAAEDLATIISTCAVPAAPAAVIVRAVAAGSTAASAGKLASTSILRGVIHMGTRTKIAATVASTMIFLAAGAAIIKNTSIVHRIFANNSSPYIATPAAVDNAPQDSGDWQTRLNAAYGLKPNEILKYIQSPLAPERLMSWQQDGVPDMVKGIPNPAALFFDFQADGNVKLHDRLGNSYLPSLLQQVFCDRTIRSWQIVMNDSLQRATLSGDWVLRVGSTPEQIMLAMEPIVQDNIQANLKIDHEKVDKEVIVISGQLARSYPEVHVHITDTRGHVVPKPMSMPGRRLPGPNGSTIYIPPATAPTTVGGGPDVLADYLSMVTNFPVVDESNKKAFHTNMAVVLESAPDNGQSEDQFLAGVMNSISQQSGLTLTREHRMVDVWTIGQVPDAK